MSVAVEPPGRGTQPFPEAGVIRDARIRQRGRRRRALALAVALAALGVAIWLMARSGSSPAPSSRRALSVFRGPRGRQELSQAYLSPILRGGAYGWCVVIRSLGSCPYVPAAPVTTVGLGGTEVPGKEPIELLLGAKVADVLVNGRRGQIVTLGRLPYGLRLAQITFPQGSGVIWHAESLRAIGADGKPLGPSQPVWGETRAAIKIRSWQRPKIRSWQRPGSLPSGPCQIRATGLAGLTAEWGHVAATIRAYPHKIVGRAFFSCIDTEYYLHNWPLEAAILLDAERPGVASPAAIPGLRPLHGLPGYFNGPRVFREDLTAVRRGNAWLVVAGGSGLSQRIEALRHLGASVSL